MLTSFPSKGAGQLFHQRDYVRARDGIVEGEEDLGSKHVSYHAWRRGNCNSQDVYLCGIQLS